jgi:hypothetical protein
VRLEELRHLKNPMTSSGIVLATFRLLAYYLNQLRYRVPPATMGDDYNHHSSMERDVFFAVMPPLSENVHNYFVQMTD